MNLEVDHDNSNSEFDPRSPDKHSMQGLLPYFIKASIWALLLYYAANAFATYSFWVVSLSVFVFSLPIALSGIYSSTVSQIQRLESFAHRGFIFRLFSGRLFKVIFWVCQAVVMAFLVLIQFHSYSRFEWLIFFAVIPVFWLCFVLCRNIVKNEYRTYLVTNKALSWSRWLCAGVMVLLYVAVSLGVADSAQYASLTEAIAAQQTTVQDMTGSALVHEISNSLAYYDGAKDYALSRIGQQDALTALALLGIGSFVLFYNAGAMLSSLLISGNEYRRVFGPLSIADQPAAVPLSRITITIAVTVFISLFVYLPLSAYLEAWAQQSTNVTTWRSEQARLVVRLEQIDNTYFREGTFAALDQARIDALNRVDLSLASLQAQADLAFDQLEMHVDDYLDWYYSLAGEYARIGSLLTGELEEFMVAKLEESLMQGAAFQELELALNSALGEHEEAQQFYQEAAARIMQQNSIAEPDSSFEVVQTMSLSDALQPPLHKDMIQLQSRLLTSTGSGALAGVLSAVIVQKVIGKVIGKNVFKVAAKALGKVVVSKSVGAVAGAGAGAGTGAVIGSVVPGIGTLVGAAIGGIVGAIAVGLTVDKVIIELEEFVKRDEFKLEILSAIEEARVEFRSSLQG